MPILVAEALIDSLAALLNDFLVLAGQECLFGLGQVGLCRMTKGKGKERAENSGEHSSAGHGLI